MIKENILPKNTYLNWRNYCFCYDKHAPRGFTLIEIVIYCAIFVTFAVFVIESIIWINSKIYFQNKITEIQKDEMYKIYFANIYKRNKIHNQKIENQFGWLIASTSSSSPILKEDRELGIILDQTKITDIDTDTDKDNGNIIFFDSILIP